MQSIVRFNHDDTSRRRGMWALVPVLALLVTCGRPGVAGAVGPDSGCALPPVTLPLFGATPAAAIAATPSPVTGIVARPLTDDEQAEADHAVRIIVACINTSVPKDVYAIFTPRYLAALFTGQHPAYQPAFEQMIAEGGTGQTPNVPPFVVKSVTNGTMLEDGRMVVTAVLDGRETTYRDTLVLVEIEDHWLIDEVIHFDPPLATPAA